MRQKCNVLVGLEYFVENNALNLASENVFSRIMLSLQMVRQIISCQC